MGVHSTGSDLALHIGKEEIVGFLLSVSGMHLLESFLVLYIDVCVFCVILCVPINICSILYVSVYWKLQGDEHFGIVLGALGFHRDLSVDGTLM